MGLMLGLLYLLATLDAAFSGYRAAAGRNARIRKGAYYRRAVAAGVLVGQGAALLLAGATIAVLAIRPDRAAVLAAGTAALPRLLAVYLPDAGVVLAMLAVRQVPSVDVRSLSSVLVFGPAVALRPVVGVGGLGWALLAAPDLAVALLGALGLGLWWSVPVGVSAAVAYWGPPDLPWPWP
jgi:hypothetical protein